MDNCFIDITVEFLGVAFHNILYYLSVYPNYIFETRRKYSVVVYRSIHLEVNEYIDLCLKSAANCLRNGELQRIEFLITTSSYDALLKFVFDINKIDEYDQTNDAYLVQAEQNMRGFCLYLTTLCDKFKGLPEDKSFMILLHTNESSAVAMTTNPNSEEFPFVETEENTQFDKIIPIRRFCVQNYNLEMFVEVK
ncbi:mitotic spindle assembly checkpoint protein MAD2B-like [Pieris napi]|uniref:mitotic spindle assembly checkpoint protein MAD2B-like n=1 Tax=Pieris napi TaxID=78633 RepID=UPI001FBA6493|nr:mitotic spindle assembly checkpoint protein MAD2B-like [Pieris napi]